MKSAIRQESSFFFFLFFSFSFLSILLSLILTIVFNLSNFLRDSNNTLFFHDIFNIYILFIFLVARILFLLLLILLGLLFSLILRIVFNLSNFLRDSNNTLFFHDIFNIYYSSSLFQYSILRVFFKFLNSSPFSVCSLLSERDFTEPEWWHVTRKRRRRLVTSY